MFTLGEASQQARHTDYPLPVQSKQQGHPAVNGNHHGFGADYGPGDSHLFTGPLPATRHTAPQYPSSSYSRPPSNGSATYDSIQSLQFDTGDSKLYSQANGELRDDRLYGQPQYPDPLPLPLPHTLPRRHAGQATPQNPNPPPVLPVIYPPESMSAFRANSDHSGDSDLWPTPAPGSNHSHSPVEPNPTPSAAPTATKPKKPRREKPRIDLAPDQPPTTQGKPRARVYVACVQCRTRKIRCDGAKPICHNCSRRASGGHDCDYDPVPKRRGPDKTPGARQRLARDLRNQLDGGAPPRRRRRRDDDRVQSTPDVAAMPLASTSAESLLVGNSKSPASAPSTHGSHESPVQLSPIVPQDHNGFTEGLEFTSDPAYLRSGSGSMWPSQCMCHGLSECPTFTSVFAPAHFKKPSDQGGHVKTYHHAFEMSNISPGYGHMDRGYITELDEDGVEQEPTYEIGAEPSLSFTRKTWWDSLLSLYISPSSTRLQSLTVSQREAASQGIAADLRFLFRTSNYWFSFFHIPTFFGSFFDPRKREQLQPSLVLAMLAMATFWQSSEVGLGRQGRERALRYRDEAQAAMDASFNAGWIDETLAQAAWLLTLFEVCAHPCHSTQRSTSSLVMLDSIIRSLSLTLMDADDPSTTLFRPNTVPVVGSPKPRTQWFPTQSVRHDSQQRSRDLSGDSTYAASLESNPSGAVVQEEKGCSCQEFTLVGRWPSSAEHAPLWCSTPAWDSSWSPAEIRKESCRRLCWSSMILAAGHISYTTAARSEGLDLFIADPANYALLFSGESVTRTPVPGSAHSSKDTIWALHDRAFLLWHGCIRMRTNSLATESDKAQFAVKAWLEADSIEATLNRHICSIERAFIFQAREYVFNTRMYISYEFQRYVPLVTANVNGMFHRVKAEEWLNHQLSVAQRFMQGLHTITGNSNNLLARRPFFIFWFMGQIYRSLTLFHCDPTLLVALDVCKALIPATNYLTSLWPCPEQRSRYKMLYAKVIQACLMAGIEAPPAWSEEGMV